MTGLKTFGALAIALVIGAGLAAMYGRHQLAATKAFADSVATAAATRDSGAMKTADSLKAIILADTARSAARTIYAAVKGAMEDSLARALKRARTAADSLPNLVAQVATLASQVDTLQAQHGDDRRALFLALARGDSLESALRADDAALQAMRRKIDALNAPALPKWARLSLEGAKDLAIFYAGVRAGKKL